jgi:hypothetical protein
MDWRPAICERTYGRRPEVGCLIGQNHAVWRVTGVEEINPGDWSERARDEWMQFGMPDPWERRPFRVLATKPQGGPQHSMLVEPWNFVAWQVVPEHYAVCSECGDPAPCRDLLGQRQAAKELAKAEADMSLPDGCCPACREPITTRQKTHRFPGPNLLNPFGLPDVEFHTRRKCHHGAAKYEHMWVAADPSRQRSLLTLRCDGGVVVHADGTGECHGAEDCPNIYARHNSYRACYTQSHGCGRGCSSANHPGTRLAQGLRRDGSRLS